MDILVCGGTKQQGIHIVNALLEEGHVVTLANRHDKTDLFGGKTKWLQLDRSNADNCRAALNGKHFDAIIDTAAYSGQFVCNLLDNVKTEYYVQLSSNAVYSDFKWNMESSAFDPKTYDPQALTYAKGHTDYNLGKRNAEKSIYKYNVPSITLRIPFVSGKNDATGRLKWFVDKVIKGETFEFAADRLPRKFAMAHESEASRFITHALKNKLTGIFNCASDGATSVSEIIGYIEEKTGIFAKYKFGKENRSHYNNLPENSLNTEAAKATGHSFLKIEDWLYDTLDYYIAQN